MIIIMKRISFISFLSLLIITPYITSCGEGSAEKEARIEAARQDSIREAQRLEAELLERERLEKERLEQERLEAERLEQERLEEEYNKEMEIMQKLHDLGEQGRAMMPQIEQLYRVQQQAQRNGILSNPDAQYNLRQALNRLLAIKDEQIKLAKQLGDANLVREYKTQRDQAQEAADLILYGQSGRVQIPY